MSYNFHTLVIVTYCYCYCARNKGRVNQITTIDQISTLLDNNTQFIGVAFFDTFPK